MASESRRATALVITRGAGNAREAYLVERSPELKFFGGYHAFPGGTVIAGDEADALTLERCALRELFEETGLIPPPLGARLGGAEREAMRRALIALDDAPWFRWLAANPDAHAGLVRLCRITTPPFAPVRYETTFFALDHHGATCEPEIWPGELVSGRFWRPDEALAEWRAGNASIVPPALLLLELLAECPGSPSFLARAEAAAQDLERGRLHPIRFTPGIFLAPLETVTKPPAITTNTLLVGEAVIYIVDPATPHPREQARLFEELDRRLRAGAQVAGVLATHSHPDHVGAIAATCSRYGAPLLAHPQAIARIDRGGAAAQALHDGERLALGRAPDGSHDWELIAHYTPGHTADHLAFTESRYHAWIVGDLLSSLSTVVIDPREGHMATYWRTLEALLRHPIGTVYPGHGPAVREGRKFIERTLAHRRAREAKLRAALATTPRTVEEILPVVYADVAPALHDLARLSLESGLIKLEEEGSAKRTGAAWRAS